MPQEKLPIIELFGPTIQGEGALTGQISYFVRTFSCSFRCNWCDSLHAVLPANRKHATYLTEEEIVGKLINLTSIDNHYKPWVTLTGGDPVIWDLSKLCILLSAEGFKVNVETQGHLWQEWLTQTDLVTCSPKGPSSGMADKLNLATLQKYDARLNNRNNKLILKIIIFDVEDLAFAKRIHRLLPKTRLYLSVGTPLYEANADLEHNVIDGFRWLTEEVLKHHPDLHDTTIGAQQHVLLWGRELGR